MTGLALAVRFFGVLSVNALWRAAVGPAWYGLAAGLAALFALWTLGWTAFVVPVEAPASALASEAALGLGLGLVATLPAYALVGAAGIGAREITRDAVPWRPLQLVVVLVAVSGALAMDLHRPLLAALVEVARLAPVGEGIGGLGGVWWAQDPVGGLAARASAMLVLALALATPVLLVLAAFEVVAAAMAGGLGEGARPSRALVRWGQVALALVSLAAALAAFPAGYGRALL